MWWWRRLLNSDPDDVCLQGSPLYHFADKKTKKMLSSLRIRNVNSLASVATPGFLSRVFLFHFEKISSYFSLFRVFR